MNSVLPTAAMHIAIFSFVDAFIFHALKRDSFFLDISRINFASRTFFFASWSSSSSLWCLFVIHKTMIYDIVRDSIYISMHFAENETPSAISLGIGRRCALKEARLKAVHDKKYMWIWSRESTLKKITPIRRHGMRKSRLIYSCSSIEFWLIVLIFAACSFIFACKVCSLRELLLGDNGIVCRLNVDNGNARC